VRKKIAVKETEEQIYEIAIEIVETEEIVVGIAIFMIDVIEDVEVRHVVEVVEAARGALCIDDIVVVKYPDQDLAPDHELLRSQ
jgi:hypothetical protein